MTRRRRRLRQAAASVLLSAALVGGAAACVDLFHSTEFTTLCTADAAACAVEAATVTDAPVGEVGPPKPIDFCAWSATEASSHAERACAWLGACGGAVEQSSFGMCMLRARAAYDCTLNPSFRPKNETALLWSCLATVTSCEAVNACLYGGASPPTCGPVSSGRFTACSQDNPSRTLVECALPGAVNPPVAIEPCVLEGRICATVDTSRAACAGKKGVACNDNSPSCSGTFASECKSVGGVPTDIGIDCNAFGSGQCIKDDAGVACAPIDTAESCTGSSKITCDDAGTVARSCVGGKAITIDCAKLSLSCSDVTATPMNPISACAELDAGARCTGPDECAGDILRSCAQGKKHELACSSVGLKTCAIPPAGRGPFATCTLP